ncbi:hypothetical protein QUA70_22910 [Microcoleus sp. LAD1_D5]
MNAPTGSTATEVDYLVTNAATLAGNSIMDSNTNSPKSCNSYEFLVCFLKDCMHPTATVA